MSVATQVSLDEYLNTSYEPDCDYIDGALEERNVGRFMHSRLQALLAALLISQERRLGICTVTANRMRVSSKRVRIPDVCVMLHGQPREEVIETPPFLCIEVLSPDDSLSSMMDRVHDYLAFGIPHIWLIDPYRERCYFATADGLIEAHDNILRTSNPEIVIPAFELFAKLAE